MNKNITSVDFVENLYHLMGWNRECRYKVLGRVAASDSVLILVFEMEEVIMFAPKKEKVRLLKEIPSEENLWQSVIAFQDYPFKTATGLPFRYKLKIGKNGEYNRELLIDRREKSKSLTWSSVVLAFENSKGISEEVKKPKALGDIRGVSYIYPILWRFGLIRVPEAIEKKMGKQR